MSFFIIAIVHFDTANDCQRKWNNLRDLYVKNKGKKLGTGSAAPANQRRQEQMAFLDECSTARKRYERCGLNFGMHGMDLNSHFIIILFFTALFQIFRMKTQTQMIVTWYASAITVMMV